MKKLNLKQPKYIFPLVVFLPLTFLAYEISNMFDGNSTASTKRCYRLSQYGTSRCRQSGNEG